MRREGLKSGPAPREELDEQERNKIEKRIQTARLPYSEQLNIPKTNSSGFASRVRDGIFKKKDVWNDTSGSEEYS